MSEPSTQGLDDIVIGVVSLPDLPNSPSPIGLDYIPEQNDLLQLVECPICRSIPVPPIFNFKNGHYACNDCRPRLTKCACCSANFTHMRNYPLEGIVTSRFLSCDFLQFGCKRGKMTMSDYENHVKRCPFQQTANRPRHNGFLSENMNLNPPKPQDKIKCSCCGASNSIRKLKCFHCETNLRKPTPLCARSPLGMISGNELLKRFPSP